MGEGVHVESRVFPGNDRFRKCINCYHGARRDHVWLWFGPAWCTYCHERALQKKCQRLQLRKIMLAVLDLQCVSILDLFVLIRDYLVDINWLVEMTVDHFNEQTLPKSIVLSLRRRRSASQRRSMLLKLSN